MRLGIERIFWRIPPIDRESGAAFQGGPGRLADDRDPARARADANTANRERSCVLQGLRLRSTPRWPFDRGVEHFRDFCVNAVAGRTSHDVASIDAFGRFSDQAEIARLLQWWIGWARKLGSVGDQGSVLNTAFTR